MGVKVMNEVINIKTEGDKLHIIHSDMHIFQYEGFNYTVEDTESIIGLVNRYGSQYNTVIFVNKNRIRVIFDDSVTTMPQDTAECKFQLSDDALDWFGCFRSPLSQKDFIGFLRRRSEGEIENLDALLASVKVLKIATETIGDYKYDECGNITFMYKTKEKEGVCTIPSVLNVTIPMLNNDSVMNIEMELEIIKPKSEDEKPAFMISCPGWSRYYKQAVEVETKKLKDALPEYLILAG
jgi:hypothetical protein